jgi:excisionase family DNA binding protein
MEDQAVVEQQHLMLTVGEVAQRLGVPVRTVRHWSDIGYLPARRTPGGQRRFSPVEVEAFAVRRRDVTALAS